MTLADAEHRVRVGSRVATGLITGAALGLVLSFVKYCAVILPDEWWPGVPAVPGPQLREWIAWLLAACRGCAVLWPVIPTLTFDVPWQHAGNYGVLLLGCLLWLGTVIRDSVRHLRARTRKTREDVQTAAWARQLSRQQGSVETSRDLLAVEIQLASQDTWYKRPYGLIALAVTSGVLVQLIRELVLRFW